MAGHCASCGAFAPWHKAGCRKLKHLLASLKVKAA